MNGILKLHLTKLSTQTQLPWLRLLPLALIKIRSTSHKPHMLSPFELMYGECAEAILPQATQEKPNTHISPGNYVFLKTLKPKSLTPSWTGPHFILLTTPTAAKLRSAVQLLTSSLGRLLISPASMIRSVQPAPPPLGDTKTQPAPSLSSPARQGSQPHDLVPGQGVQPQVPWPWPVPHSLTQTRRATRPQNRRTTKPINAPPEAIFFLNGNKELLPGGGPRAGENAGG
ncbi:hypothetical protein QTO34_014206 [Cnephaeus nilssonii]|uniref:Murine leukemia virus integrase C-terminal domain-containing protein n=1 Tax=Cnephaeus nilssonii TaxID=3371016 RepID=A0AA40I5Y2_CNENI|nr:hypothetical protein QTO34_014206 [Eptesicus nilssonii]